MTGLVGTIPSEIGELKLLKGFNIYDTCLKVNNESNKAIKSLDVYKNGNSYFNYNCINKSQLPLGNIKSSNCSACPSCKIEPISNISINNSILKIYYSDSPCK